jgi:putative endonuclease
MTKQRNYQKGRDQENRAKEFLIERGLELIETNYKNKLGEIDVVMSDGDCLVFVEVKYKANDLMGLPEEMLDQKKLLQIRRVAEVYLMTLPELRQKFKKYRIDAVCILGREIRYYKNVC